ncbi:MAG: type I-E CRISPR-associated protein Cas7/Cse4/CasC [Ardenticatenaceae bacterium]|nr:type I-E CRISPR-associated protein Cas7/Cse4/CasC [Ardenticatenaceae bacterium]
MLIQIHMLQNYVPSLLNRDDSGAAKSAPFGGRQRGRISSQCLKRSIRLSDSFQDAFKKDGLLADRTKRLPKLVAAALRELGAGEAVCTAIAERTAEIGQESKKRDSKTVDLENLETRQLIFIGANEVKAIAQKLLDLYNEDPKKWEKRKIDEITDALGSSVPRSVDIAMFGRMTTSAAFEDIQASVQVAHALATNELVRVYDFFTAVDDLKNQDDDADAGAGMIGDVELNSSTYYKYFNIHWEGLVKNLGGDEEVAAKAVLAFIEAAAVAQPSGKQNSTAALNLPDFVLVEVSDKNLPVNYANAYLQPAAPWANETLMQNAVSKLDGYGQKLRRAYGLNGQRAYFSTEEVSLGDADDLQSLPALQEWVGAQIAEAAHAA